MYSRSNWFDLIKKRLLIIEKALKIKSYGVIN
jgi:hypothetical protein